MNEGGKVRLEVMTEEKQQDRGPARRPSSGPKTRPRTEPAVVVGAERSEELSSVEPGGSEPSEGARSGRPPTTAAPSSPSPAPTPPDPEVSERPVRRQFTAAYKLRILLEADRCKDTNGIGSLLRREGLYSSHLGTWRKQRDDGSLSALAPRKRGRPAEKPHPDTQRLAQSERKIKHLERRLKQAEALVELQKKVSEILGIVLPPAPIDEAE